MKKVVPWCSFGANTLYEEGGGNPLAPETKTSIPSLPATNESENKKRRHFHIVQPSDDRNRFCDNFVQKEEPYILKVENI